MYGVSKYATHTYAGKDNTGKSFFMSVISSVTTTDTRKFIVIKVISYNITTTDKVIYKAFKAIYDSTTIQSAITATKTTIQTITDTIAAVSKIVASATKILTSHIITSDTLNAIRQFYRTLSAGITMIDTTIAAKHLHKAISDTINTTSSLAIRTYRALGDIIYTIDKIKNTIRKTFSNTVTVQDVISTLHTMVLKNTINTISKLNNLNVFKVLKEKITINEYINKLLNGMEIWYNKYKDTARNWSDKFTDTAKTWINKYK